MKKALSRNRKQILLALALSATSYAITHVLYMWTEPAREESPQKDPIAFASSVTSEVQRRPVSRFIWFGLNPGDAVYPGEAVKTSSDGEIQLEFVGTQQKLVLEPDTLVVLRKSEGEISLNLMDGHIAVAGDSQDSAEQGPRLTVESESGKIDVSKATANFSKRNGKVEVEVLKGEITRGEVRKQEDGSPSASEPVNLLAKTEFTTLQDGRTEFVLKPGSPMDIAWSPAPASLPLEIWMGPRRKHLRKVQDLPPGGTSWSWAADTGTWFLQLRGGADHFTRTLRFEVRQFEAPLLLAPADREVIPMTKSSDLVVLRWAPNPESTAQTLEVASDPRFSKIVSRENLSPSINNKSLALEPGSYVWRVGGYRKTGRLMAPSSPRSFKVQAQAPQIQSLRWTSPAEDRFQFLKEPRIEVSWEEGSEIVKWSLVAESRSDKGPLRIQKEIKEPKWAANLPADGTWSIEVEGFDSDGVKRAQLPLRTLQVELLPLLSAPSWAKPEPRQEASLAGDATLEWIPVDGTKEYLLTIEDAKGRSRQRRGPASAQKFESLLPGTYRVRVTPVDSHGREGAPSSEKELVVPDRSGLSAPKLRKLRVN